MPCLRVLSHLGVEEKTLVCGNTGLLDVELAVGVGPRLKYRPLKHKREAAGDPHPIIVNVHYVALFL
jgi:hypothetical protein